MPVKYEEKKKLSKSVKSEVKNIIHKNQSERQWSVRRDSHAPPSKHELRERREKDSHAHSLILFSPRPTRRREVAGGCVHRAGEGWAAVSSVASLEWTLDTRPLYCLPGDTHSFVRLCLDSR